VTGSDRINSDIFDIETLNNALISERKNHLRPHRFDQFNHLLDTISSFRLCTAIGIAISKFHGLLPLGRGQGPSFSFAQQ
jgi:hypothetical protein